MKSTDKKIFLILIVTALIKVITAYYIPLTGDEAYFAIWGKYLDLGYYDHTPLIGWILHPLLYFGYHNIVLRLPSIIVSMLIGFGIYRFVAREYPEKAVLAATLFLISPLSLFGVFVTTDVPLALFTFFSVMLLFKALKADEWKYYLWSGLCLGLAFFSKYFAVLLGMTYLIYFIFAAKSRQRTLGFLLLFLSVLPFGLINIYWNYTHDWSNIMFNVFNRNEGVSFGLWNIVHYLLILFYVLTPPLFYYAIKERKQIKKLFNTQYSLIAASFVIPFAFFLILSTVKSVGVHWPISFVPFAYLSLCLILTEKNLKTCILWNAIFSSLHGVILLVGLIIPITFFQNIGFKDANYSELVFVMKHDDIRQKLTQYDANYLVSSPSYAKAALMTITPSNYDDKYSPMFGMGSVHGRQDDLLYDYKVMRHKNFVFIFTEPPRLENYQPYFREMETSEFTIYGAKYYLLFGRGFNYEVYRDKILQPIHQRYWQVPHWLPHGEDFFFKKYFESTK